VTEELLMEAQLILASGSSARRDLLKNILGDSFVAVRPTKELVIPPKGDFKKACRNAVLSALIKALSVIEENAVQGDYIVGADTVIYFKGRVLGKPRDESEARDFLAMLRGSWHAVITGIAVIGLRKRTIMVDYVTTHVKMRNYSDEEIDAYLSTGEWMGKAGGYAIQGRGALLVEAIIGCFFNVVGLPLSKLYELTTSAGLRPDVWWSALST